MRLLMLSVCNAFGAYSAGCHLVPNDQDERDYSSADKQAKEAILFANSMQMFGFVPADGALTDCNDCSGVGGCTACADNGVLDPVCSLFLMEMQSP